MSNNFDKQSSLAPILESYIEAPAAIKAGLGGLVGSLGLKGASSSNKAIRNSSIVAAPIAAYAIGGGAGLAGAAAPLLVSNSGIAMPTLLAATVGQTSDAIKHITPMLTDFTSANVKDAIPSYLGAAYLGKLTSEVPEIKKTLEARRSLKARLLDPDVNPNILKEDLNNLNLDLATTHILPGGSIVKKIIKKRNDNKYIAKEMKEVAELLKTPGTNYKTSSYEKRAFGTGLGNLFKNNPAVIGTALAGGTVGAFLGSKNNGGASGAAKGFLTGAAAGAAAPGVVNKIQGIAPFIGKGLAGAGKATTTGLGNAYRATTTGVSRGANYANTGIQNTGAGYGNIMGIAGGAAAGGYAGYQAGGDELGTTGALTGALGGAFLGRGMARAGHMALGTNRGRALTQQAQMQGRTGARQAFGGFRTSNADLNTLAQQQATRSNAVIQQNQAQLQSTLQKDVGLGGYGLNAAQANQVGTELNKATQYATGAAPSNFIQRGVERFKNIRNMDYANANQVSNYVVPGVIHGAVGAGAGYAADTSMGGTGYTGAILGGLAGAVGGGSRFNQQLGKTLTSRSRSVAEQYSQQLATSPELQRRVLGRTGNALAADSNAATQSLGKQLRGTVNTLEAAAPGSIKPQKNSLSVVNGNIQFTKGTGGTPDLNLADDIAQNLGAKNPDLVKSQLQSALPSNSQDKEILSNMLAKGGPEAEQLTNVLNSHSKEIVNISNQVHDDVANAVISQGKRIDSASTFTRGGSPLAGGGVDPAYLMSQPSMKQLANDLSNGTLKSVDEIKAAINAAGISAPGYADEMAEALKYQFDDIANAAKNNLDKASTNMKNNLIGTQINIQAKAHANEISNVTSAFERAKTFADPNDLALLQAHGNDLVELQMRQGPAGQRLATQTLKQMTEALQSSDPSKIKTLANDLNTQVGTALSQQSAAGFQRATSGVSSAAKNIFKGDFDDQFLGNAKSFVQPGSKTDMALDAINALDDVAKKQFMTGKVNIDSADVAQLNSLAQQVGAKSFKVFTSKNTVLKGVITDPNQALQAISGRITPGKITSALSGKGNSTKSLQEIENILVSVGAVSPGKLTPQALEELVNAKNTWSKSLEKSISTFKTNFAAEAGANPISSKGLNVKQLSGRTTTTIDDAALQTAQRNATEAPIVNTTQAPVSLTSTSRGWASAPTKAILGAGAVGAAGYGGYNYLKAPTAEDKR